MHRPNHAALIIAAASLLPGCGAMLGASCEVDADCRQDLACRAGGQPGADGNAIGSCRDADEAPRPTAEPGAAASLDSSWVDEALRCDLDEDCLATQFHDCCADNRGQCTCDWQAVNRGWAEQALLECGAEECTDGTCHACPPTQQSGEARCVAHQCALTPRP